MNTRFVVRKKKQEIADTWGSGYRARGSGLKRVGLKTQDSVLKTQDWNGMELEFTLITRWTGRRSSSDDLLLSAVPLGQPKVT